MNEKQYSILLALNLTLLVSFSYQVFAVSEAVIFLFILTLINYFVADKCHRLYKPVRNFKDYPTKGMKYANYVFLFIIIVSFIITFILRNKIIDKFPDPLLFVIILNLVLACIFLLVMVIVTVTIDYLEYKKTKKVNIIEIIFQSIVSNLIILGIVVFAYYVIGAGVGMASF